jgi:hypothetical protein
MSTLGNIYLAMEKDKSNLEKILEIYTQAKRIKYVVDEKHKLVPISRMANIGKGVCYDHARYHAYLASKYKLPYRCFLYISTDKDGVPYELPGNEPCLGDSHADCYIYADDRWYYNGTTGNYSKKLIACDGDKLDYVLAAILSDRIKYGQRTDVRGATSQEISDTVASTMIDYFNQYRSKASEMLYEVTDFADAKYDNMTYKKLVEHVVKNCRPYVFDDKVLAAVKNDKLSYDDLMFNVA